MKRNKAYVLLSVSLIGAIAAAILFMIVHFFFLPETDEARKAPFYYLFIDPFILTVAIPVTLVSGLLAFVISLFTLRHADLRKAIPIVFGAVFVVTAGAAPFGLIVALLGSFSVLIAAMVYCRLSRVGRTQGHS